MEIDMAINMEIYMELWNTAYGLVNLKPWRPTFKIGSVDDQLATSWAAIVGFL